MTIKRNHIKEVNYSFDEKAHCTFVNYHDELCDKNFYKR